PAGDNSAGAEGAPAGDNSAGAEGAPVEEKPEEAGTMPAGEHSPYEGKSPEKEGGDSIEAEKISPGEVDERISSYVKEHIRNGGRRRKISAFRILFFAVLITIVIFFFVDYVLMKKQIVSGWFSQDSTADKDGSGSDRSEDGENDTAAADDGQTESTPQAAGENTTASNESDPEGRSGEAQSGDGNTQTLEDGEESSPGEKSETGEGLGETDTSAEQEMTADPAETVVQYLVYIEVTELSGQQNLTEDSPETTTAGNTGQDEEETHETAGVIVEIGQSAVRVLTDYSSVEFAENIEITFNGGETAVAQVETADSNTGLALLAVSVTDLSNETLKEIRMATWGDTAEIGVGTGLLLATAGGKGRTVESSGAVESGEVGENSGIVDNGGAVESDGTGESGETGKNSEAGGNDETVESSRTEESGETVENGEAGENSEIESTGEKLQADSELPVLLAEIKILAIGEKKQPDTVFTTYSFDTDVEGCRILVDENGDIVAISTGAADGTAGGTETASGGETAVAYCADDLRGYIEKMVDGVDIPYVGITGVTVTDEIKESVSLDMPYGVYVWLADTGSPAYQAGILNGDIITAINGVEITTVQEMRDAILGLEAGVEASFTLMRQGGKTYREYTIEVTPEVAETVLNPEMTN
ncbi:MAG: PDZ domain-containing protein, partial [Lachnospiraceae bacterium]|nr:PDZ domain-containing protein [Lachnospiraceae bacterium]